VAGKVTVGSGVAQAMCHRRGLSTYGLNGLGRRDEHPPTLQRGMASFTLHLHQRHNLERLWKKLVSYTVAAAEAGAAAAADIHTTYGRKSGKRHVQPEG